MSSIGDGDAIAVLLERIQSSVKNRLKALKLISEFRMRFPEFRYDSQLNAAKLFVLQNKIVQASMLLQLILP